MSCLRQEYFLALVDSTVEASVRYVREYVHAYLTDTLKEARGRIQEYADSFSHTMQAALATQEQGALCSRPVLAYCTCSALAVLLLCVLLIGVPCLGNEIVDDAIVAGYH